MTEMGRRGSANRPARARLVRQVHGRSRQPSRAAPRFHAVRGALLGLPVRPVHRHLHLLRDRRGDQRLPGLLAARRGRDVPVRLALGGVVGSVGFYLVPLLCSRSAAFEVAYRLHLAMAETWSVHHSAGSRSWAAAGCAR